MVCHIGSGDYCMHKSLPSPTRGFTVIELMVVLAVIGLLMGVVVPRYFQHIDRAKESTLKHNLFVLRDAIDKYFADNGKYPESLVALADAKYIRAVPEDPITQRKDGWTLVAPTNKDLDGVYDVKSSAPGNARDGSAYAQW
jgi:general secretion pathway protein G